MSGSVEKDIIRLDDEGRGEGREGGRGGKGGVEGGQWESIISMIFFETF